jgi:hypothetical protein
MRTLVLTVFVLLTACGDKPGTAARDKPPPDGKLDIVMVMPALFTLMDAEPPLEATVRSARFQREVIEAFPSLYGPVIPDNPEFDVEDYLQQLEPLLPTLHDLDRRTYSQVEASARLLNMHVGRLPDLTIYVAPSLFTSNGQVRVVNDVPVVMFGVDVQAYAEEQLLPQASRYDLRAYVAHELFHAYHYSVNQELRGLANTLFDEKDPAPLYVNLWIEGLATCVSMGLDGDGSPARALMSEQMARELPPALARVASEMIAKVDSRNLADTRDFFWLGGERKDIPARSAYGVGAWVAGDVLARVGLQTALRLSGESLRAEVTDSLRRLGRLTAPPAWTSFCQALPRG